MNVGNAASAARSTVRPPKRVLLTNDDGPDSPFFHPFVECLKKFGCACFSRTSLEAQHTIDPERHDFSKPCVSPAAGTSSFASLQQMPPSLPRASLHTSRSRSAPSDDPPNVAMSSARGVGGCSNASELAF